MAIPTESLPPPGRGSTEIDFLLGAFPGGQLSEIVGPWSSGGESLLLALLARATAGGRLAALVDGADAFDPTVAAAAGANLSALLWVRCGGDTVRALRAADLLARCPGFAVVALDLGEGLSSRRQPVPPTAWRRLQRAVEGSGAALVLRVPRHVAGAAAALVLEAERGRAQWVGSPRPTRLDGLLSRVRVLRSRAPAPLQAEGVWTLSWRL
ncbi:MAG: hypothetical protein Q8Q58_14450 [Candidatus Rokubacteria bacterium]|nr:hypothetical protein [Candidatus Rokubacteria bacterium]